MAEVTFEAKIVEIIPGPVLRISLRVPATYQFIPGQYLYVIHPDGTQIPLSIASSSHRLPIIELHYRSTPGVVEAQAMDQLLLDKHIQISPAAGSVLCPTNSPPVLIAAAGTGAAQGFSCAEFRSHKNLPTTMLWCVAQDAEVYHTGRVAQWPKVNMEIHVDSTLGLGNKGLCWLAQHVECNSYEHIILAGGVEFVYTVTDMLTHLGVEQNRLYADVYSYAPMP